MAPSFQDKPILPKLGTVDGLYIQWSYKLETYIRTYIQFVLMHIHAYSIFQYIYI